MAVIAPLASTTQYEIPSRVNCAVALQLGASNIPGAGRGIFVLQSVTQGALLFEVPNVLYSVVSRFPLLITPFLCFQSFNI